MRPGMRTSSFPGSVEDAILELQLSLLPGGGAGGVRITPAAQYGARRYALYVNGRRERDWQFAAAESAVLPLVLPPEAGAVSVCVEDLGDWNDPAYDPNQTALETEATTADHIHAAWQAPLDYVPRGTSAALEQISAWQLSGIKRFTNCAAVEHWPTRAQLSVELIVAGATRTLRLYANAIAVAEGSRSGDGVVTLTELNESSISGSAAVAAAGGFAAADYTLELRFPRAYEFHYSTSALSFPRAAEQTAVDDGSSNLFAAVSLQLAAGTYHVAIVPVSDTGVARSSIVSQQVTLAAPPQAPTNLAYDSGNAAATVIRWTSSATAGATYKIYDSDADQPPKMSAAVATHGAGSGTLTLTLPAFSGPGMRRIIVRAVNGGAEERNADVLEIEYAADGSVLGKRPNSPRIQNIVVNTGRQVTVSVLYFSAGEKQAAATAKLFLVAAGAAIDYASPTASATFDTAIAGVRQATLIATAPADGFFNVAVRAAGSDGTQDANTVVERVHVANVEPAAAIDVSIYPARS